LVLYDENLFVFYDENPLGENIQIKHEKWNQILWKIKKFTSKNFHV